MNEDGYDNSSASTPASLPPKEASGEPRTLSLAEIEYKSLNSYFERILKLTLLMITVVLAVAGTFLWRSSSDAKSSIEVTRIEAAREIENVGKQSSEIARTEARQRIDEAFEKENVQQMIERVARERVDTAVDRQIDKNLSARIKGLQDEIAAIGDVAGAASRLRLGFREGWDTLVRQSNNSDESVRRYARASLLMIGADYETVLNKQFGGMTATQLVASLASPKEPPKNPREVLEIIRHSDRMEAVAASFLLLREMTGTKIQVFDIPTAEKWCADNKPKCE
jgi:hypothetical protein